MPCNGVKTASVTCSISLIITISLIWRYKRSNNIHNNTKKETRALGYTTYIFFAIVCACFLTHFTTHATSCYAYYHPTSRAKRIYTYIFALHSGIYGIVLWVMLAIFFIKVYIIFKGTPLHLSQCTRRCFAVFFIIDVLLPISLAISLLLSDHRKLISAILLLFTFIFAISTLISIISLFINKMIKTYKILMNDDDLIKIITKTIILTFTSIFITILTFLAFIIDSVRTGGNPNIWVVVTTIMGDFDVLTNFLCIIFAYEFNTKYYQIFCGGMDKICHKLWLKCATRNIALDNIQSNPLDETSNI